MAITMTKVSGPSTLCPKVSMAVYNCAWDTDYTTGGDNLTSIATDFDYVYSINVGGNDTLADNGYIVQAIQPAPGTAVTTSNVKLTVHWDQDPADTGGANIPMTEFTDDGDLSAIGQLTIVVFGQGK